MSISEFTPQEIKLINVFLTKHVKNNCISSTVIYDALKSELDFSKSRFCNNLSVSINKRIIKGFELRKGRNGGVHRKGVFSGHDKNRKVETKRQKRKYTKRNFKGLCCDVEIDNIQYRARINEAKLCTFILNVLEADVDDSQANVIVGTIGFKVQQINILKLFITSYCGTESVDTSS